MFQSIRVLALHHNLILREGLSVLIDMQQDMVLVGSVERPDTAIRLFAKEHPDVVLIDLDLPSDGWTQAFQGIREIDRDSAAIGLITDDWDENGMRAMEAGMGSVLAKDLIGDMLVPIIRAAAARRFALDLLKRGSPQF